MTMRAYIRHPSDVPIELLALNPSAPAFGLVPTNSVQDVSLGGLSFNSPEPLPVGAKIKIRISVVSPPFEAEAQVVWSVPRPDRYETGVEFISSEDAYTARMVEQICHIEHYRIWVKEVEGRDLDSEHAAMEWISKYAEDFPNANAPTLN